MGSMRVNGNYVTFTNTSSYDSVTEILSHAIRLGKRLEEYFQYNNKDQLCYSATVLEHAKYGPNSNAYKSRATILYSISTRAYNSIINVTYQPLELLSTLLHNNLDVGQLVSCRFCSFAKCVITLDIGKVCTPGVEKIILEHFREKDISCRQCNWISKKRPELMHTLPLFCITIRYTRSEKEKKYLLNMLPEIITLEGCDYVLCGVIGRTRMLEDNLSYHYVAYCRTSGGKWDKRDSFNEEIETLTEMPIIDFSQLFYVNVGFWNAEKRKLLLEPAKSAWYQVTKINLPDLCLHLVFSFLDNRQLQNLIDAENVSKV